MALPTWGQICCVSVLQPLLLALVECSYVFAVGLLFKRSKYSSTYGFGFFCHIYEPFSHFVVILWLLCHIYEPFSHLVVLMSYMCQ